MRTGPAEFLRNSTQEKDGGNVRRLEQSETKEIVDPVGYV